MISEALDAAGDRFGAAAAGQRETAAQLVDYFMEEAKVVYVIYRVWMEGFLDWLRARGLAEDEIGAEVDRLCALLAYPDGSRLDPAARWAELSESAGRLAHGVRSFDLTVAAAKVELEALRVAWRMLHDRYADLMAGILAFVARRFGEPALEDCYRAVLEPYIDERYAVFDLRRQPYEATVTRNLYIALEAMRGHLVGPRRDGEVELEEFEDRWELRFDPCGSGGRQLRGDPDEGTGSRVLAPYEFGVTQRRYPWAWNEIGVCYYCAHCNFALSTIPAERWGHPIRTVQPPLWGGSPDAPSTRRKCQWTIYKSLEAIPEEEYVRIGRGKPPPSPSASVPDSVPDSVLAPQAGRRSRGPAGPA
jgi:hypothetical protein